MQRGRSLRRQLASKSRPRVGARRLTCEPLETRCLFAVGVGQLDPTFDTNGQQFVAFDGGNGNNDIATAEVIQADGKIVLAGYMSTGSGNNNDFAVTRLNADGTLDTTFGTSGKTTIGFDLGGSNDDRAKGVALLPDGSIIVVGYAQKSATDYNFAVAKLTSTGLLDTTFDGDGKQTVAFDLGGNNVDLGQAVVIDTAHHRILVAGSADSAAGNEDFAIAGLTFAGALDTTFGTANTGKRTIAFGLGGGLNDDAAAIALDPVTGNIVLAGKAQVSATNYDMAVARLAADGVLLDTTFDGDGKQTVAFDIAGSDIDAANAVVVTPDSRVILAGAAETGTGNTDFALAQLTSTGALDTTFDGDGKQTIAFNLGAAGLQLDAASSLVRQADGKLVVAGLAQMTASDYDVAVVRLTSAGAADTTFGAAANGKVVVALNRGGTNEDVGNAVALQSDGDIVVAGSSDKGGTGNRDFAAVRLVGDNAQSAAVQIPGTAGADDFKLTFTSATSFTVSLDNVVHTYSTGQVTSLAFDSFDGIDKATVQDTFNIRSGSINASALAFAGSDFGLHTTHTEQVYLTGRAGDAITMTTAAAGSTAIVKQAFSSLQGAANAFIYQATAIPTVTINGAGGSATLYSQPNASLDARTLAVKLTLPDGVRTVNGLDHTVTYSTGDASEHARLVGGNVAEKFIATATYAYLTNATGTPFFNEVVDYRRVDAASGGGNDLAELYDTSGDELFVTTPTYAYLSGGSGSKAFFNEASGFKQTNAHASGGVDTAYYYDSTGNDTFKSYTNYSYMVTGATTNIGYGFDRVHAEARSGNDRAFLYDGGGTNNFFGQSSSAQLQRVSDGNVAFADGFDAVTVTQSTGSDDHKSFSTVDYVLTFVGTWK